MIDIFYQFLFLFHQLLAPVVGKKNKFISFRERPPDNHTQFWTTLFKFYTRFQSKTAQKAYPLGQHLLYTWYKGSTFPRCHILLANESHIILANKPLIEQNCKRVWKTTMAACIYKLMLTWRPFTSQQIINFYTHICHPALRELTCVDKVPNKFFKLFSSMYVLYLTTFSLI